MPLARATIGTASGRGQPRLGLGGGWACMRLDVVGDPLIAMGTGPGAVVTSAVGGVAGGLAGYYGFDWIADHVEES